MDPNNEVKSFTRIRSLISGMLFITCIGAYYSYGNINDVIYNYLKNNGNPDITAQDCLIVQPIWLIIQSIFTAVGVMLANKVGFRTANCVALGCFSLVNLLCSYLTNYYALIYLYGALGGATCGLGYVTGIYIAWTYYPEKKGLATGIIFFAAGIASSILSPFTTYLVNPNNDYKPTDQEMYSQVPRMFRILALCFGVIVVIAALIQPPPLESQELKNKIKQSQKSKSSVNDQQRRSVNDKVSITE